MAVFALTSTKTQVGSAWTGTGPGDGNPTISGTITSATDISSMLYQVEIDIQADELDYTNFASGGWKYKGVGLSSGTIKLSFYQNFAASNVDALFGIGGSVIAFASAGYVDIMATSSSRGSTNPSYVAYVLNNQYTPIKGNVGDKATLDVTWPISGKVGRLTS